MSESLEESYSSPTRLLKKITKCWYNMLMDNPSEMGIKPMDNRVGKMPGGTEPWAPLEGNHDNPMSGTQQASSHWEPQ